MSAASPPAGNPVVPAALSFVLPGLGHMVLGRVRTGLVFLASIGLLFVSGLFMEGEFFPVNEAAPLTLLAGLAEMGIGVPYVLANLLDLGQGSPAAPAYEYGYAFLISAGLLNLLVVLDAWDIARGAKEGG